MKINDLLDLEKLTNENARVFLKQFVEEDERGIRGKVIALAGRGDDVDFILHVEGALANGITSGNFDGFIYPHDSQDFARNNLKEIRKELASDADDFGFTSHVAMLKNMPNFEDINEENIMECLYDPTAKNEDAPFIYHNIAAHVAGKVSQDFIDYMQQGDNMKLLQMEIDKSIGDRKLGDQVR